MEWVVFDYAGVVSHHQSEQRKNALVEAARTTAAAFWEAYWAERPSYDKGAVVSSVYWQAVASRLGQRWSRDEIDELIRLDILSWVELNQGTLEVVRRLDESGVRLALLSNAPRELADAVRSMPEMAVFDPQLFSCDLGTAKPARECFLLLLERLGSDADEVTFIDDRPENLAAAAEVGIRTVLFTEPEELVA